MTVTEAGGTNWKNLGTMHHCVETIWYQIDLQTFAKCARVCKSWNAFSKDDRFWQEFARRFSYFIVGKEYFSFDARQRFMECYWQVSHVSFASQEEIHQPNTLDLRAHKKTKEVHFVGALHGLQVDFFSATNLLSITPKIDTPLVDIEYVPGSYSDDDTSEDEQEMTIE